MQARELDRCEQILVRNSRSCCGTEMDNQVGHRRTVGEPRRERQGTGSSPALMRAMISAARWRACSAPSTGLAPDGQAEADSIAVDRSGHQAMGSAPIVLSCLFVSRNPAFPK